MVLIKSSIKLRNKIESLNISLNDKNELLEIIREYKQEIIKKH